MNHRAAILCTAAALFMPAAAPAADFESLAPAELARRANDVVHARVVSVQTETGPLPGVAGVVPIRRLTLRVHEPWRGECRPGEPLDILVPGGRRPDGTSVMVSTSPSTDGLEGRDVVVFVRRDLYGAERHGIEAGMFGLYRVVSRGTRSAAPATPMLRGQAGSPFPLDTPLPSARAAIAAERDRRR
jgi:hypothetical protein